MAERNQFDRLDDAIDAIVARRTPPAMDPELATLLVVAADLRDLPDPRFRARLRSELIPNDEEAEMKTATAVKSVRPYLIVPGADDLIAFLERTFDAEVLLRVPTPEGQVMHAEVRVGESIVEMGDASERWKAMTPPLHVYLENVDEVYERALAAGATSIYPPTTMAEYGARESGVTDRFGTQWFIAKHLEGGPRPPGFSTVTPAIRVEGAARLLSFIESAFGGVELSRTPSPSGGIRHAEVKIGETMFEVGDAHGDWGPTRGAFHLFVEDTDEVYEQALAAGAKSILPPEDMPYGERSATVDDGFGNLWFIAKKLA